MVTSYMGGLPPLSDVNLHGTQIHSVEGPSYLKVTYKDLIMAYRKTHIHLIDKFDI